MSPTQDNSELDSAKKNTVLIVDDEPDIREYLNKILTRNGFNTLMASSGKKAFEIISTTHVDAIVSDIQMPDGDGIELLKLVRQRDSEKPAILLISGNSKYTLDEYLALGAQDFFDKPFERDVLVRRLRECLNVA